MMTAFRVILLMTLVVSGIGTIADEKKKGSLLCLFALAGTLMRTIAKAKTIEEMREMLNSTADRLENRHDRKRFPKSESFDLIAELRKAARKIMRGVHAANETNFNERPEDRLIEIKAVIDECNLMLKLVELSHDMEYIDTKRMGTWTKKILDVKYMCLAWLKKDGARAKDIHRKEADRETERLIRLVREIMDQERRSRASPQGGASAPPSQ